MYSWGHKSKLVGHVPCRAHALLTDAYPFSCNSCYSNNNTCADSKGGGGGGGEKFLKPYVVDELEHCLQIPV